jgi:CRP-like cAMP-binding protein
MIDKDEDFKRLRDVLHSTYFFHSLKIVELDKLVNGLRMIRVQKGYEIIKQGDPGDAFYLIASGRVSVWKRKGFIREKLVELKTNDFFGEMALISNEPRNATVIAEEITELFILDKYDFTEIFMRNPAIARELKRAFHSRER